tara:strand:- start:301 stop:585 length:285 start_codon:yes stop_codon:yes gene_type:complete
VRRRRLRRFFAFSVPRREVHGRGLGLLARAAAREVRGRGLGLLARAAGAVVPTSRASCPERWPGLLFGYFFRNYFYCMMMANGVAGSMTFLFAS